MIAEFLIFLREGLEGSMIISILLASLRQIGQPERTREVWWGVAAALVVAFSGGVLVYVALHAYSGTPLQTAIEGHVKAVYIRTLLSQREAYGIIPGGGNDE